MRKFCWERGEELAKEYEYVQGASTKLSAKLTISEGTRKTASIRIAQKVRT